MVIIRDISIEEVLDYMEKVLVVSGKMVKPSSL